MALSFLRNRKEWPIPASIFAAALFARLYMLFTHRYPMMIHEQDAVGYMAVAENIRSFHPFFSEIRPPAYPFLIVLFSLLPMDLELAARMASVFMDAMIVVPLYCLGRTFLGRSGAAAAAILWTFFSFSLYFSISPLSQSTFLFFLCCGILFHTMGSGEGEWRTRTLFIAGVFFALSYLARPEGVVPFGVACASSVLLSSIVRKERKGKLVGSLSLIAGFLVAAGPYLLFLRSRLGYWGVTGKSDMAVKTADTILTLDANGNLPPASKGIEAWKTAYGNIENILNAFVANISQFAKVFYSTFPFWVHILAAAGAALLVTRKKWRALFCLFLLVVATLPDYVVNIPKTHSYIYAVFPAVFFLFSVFWQEAAGLSRGFMEKCLNLPVDGLSRGVVTAMILVPSILLSMIFFAQAREALEDPGLLREALMSEMIYRESGRFIGNISRPDDRIMTRWGLIGYFAGREVITLPKGGVQEVVEYGRRNGVRFMVIDTNSVLSRRQELMELLGPLRGETVGRKYGIEPLKWKFYPDLGGYVVYGYAR